MSRAGRKRKAQVTRYAGSGAIVRAERGESPDEARAVGMANPDRRGKPSPDSRYHGYALGTLYFTRNITSDQFHAGERFIAISGQYSIVMCSPKRTPKSPGFEMVSHGLPSLKDIVDEFDEQEIERQAAIRRAYSEALEVILREEAYHRGMWLALLWVCVDDHEPNNDLVLGNLRCALNLLARLWKS